MTRKIRNVRYYDKWSQKRKKERRDKKTEDKDICPYFQIMSQYYLYNLNRITMWSQGIAGIGIFHGI